MRTMASRREFLRYVGTAVGGGTLATTAGCSDGGDGDTETTATVTTSVRETHRPYEGPAYGRWLPAPPAIASARYPFSAVNLSAFTVRGDTLPPGLQRSPHVDGWEPVQMDWRDVTLSLGIRGSFVIQGEYDPGGVAQEVATIDGWSDAGTYQGYDLLVTPDESGAVAVSDESIVVASPPGSGATAVDAAEVIVDTGRGAAERYGASSEELDDFVDEVGNGSIVEWQPRDPPHEADPEAGRFAGQVGLGRWGRVVDAETTDVKLVIVFDDVSAAEQADLEAYVDANREQGPFAGWADLVISRNGRLGVITGTVTSG